MRTIAIQPDRVRLKSGRIQSFSERWLEQLPRLGHEARVVDLLRPDLFEQLADCDGVMWWFTPRPFPRNFAVRLIAAIDQGLGLPTFPDQRSSWHFDDKVAQFYLLRAAGLPMPPTWTFWKREDAREFCHGARYPLVLKLAGGIMSENVLLLRSAREADIWIRRLFGRGVLALYRPSLRRPKILARDTASLLWHLTTGRPRFEWLRSDVQRGYFMVQEFVGGNGYDTRAVVIGKRAFAFRRFNRPHDFRASGSGLRDGDPAAIDPEIVRLAFRVAAALGTYQSMGIDVLYREGERVITEISHHYEGWILHEECPGHWELDGDPVTGTLRWADGPMRPEDGILEDFLTSLERRTGPPASDHPAPQAAGAS